MNNYENPNYGNPYFQGGVVQNQVTAKTILDDLNITIHKIINEGLPSNVLIEKLESLERNGYIRTVGFGSNRRCIEIIPDMRQVLNDIGFFNNSVPTVVMVPFNIKSGRLDNLREGLVPSVLNVHASTIPNSPALKLMTVLPYAKVYDKNGYLLIQERVVPIEHSNALRNFMNSKGIDIRNTKDDEIGQSIVEMFNESPMLQNEYNNLLSMMDKVFIMWDLNLMYSTFNYGFKTVNGKTFLTILDMGYVLPRIPAVEPKCPNDGVTLEYFSCYDPSINNNNARKERVLNRFYAGGLYRCSSVNDCMAKGPQKTGDEFMVDDSSVFMWYEENLRNAWRTGAVNLSEEIIQVLF